jgi:hypothetical protein
MYGVLTPDQNCSAIRDAIRLTSFWEEGDGASGSDQREFTSAEVVWAHSPPISPKLVVHGGEHDHHGRHGQHPGPSSGEPGDDDASNENHQ